MPEHLPGEPEPRDRWGVVRALRLAGRAVATLLLAAVAVPFWPVYLALSARFGWAPNVPRLRQVVRYLRLARTVQPPPPGLGVVDRVWLTLSILRFGATAAIWGTAWHLDEVLYGDALRSVRIERPLLEVSAARSGSTQLARYLEEDPRLVAPPLVCCVFPFLWAWRLAPRTLGRVVSGERFTRLLLAKVPPAFTERHETDPFRTDTFEVPFLSSHLNALSLRLGPDVLADDFAFGALAPHNRTLWEHDFVAFFDGIARKTLLDAAPGPDGRARRLFVKGHFLVAAPFLGERHPDAVFLTVLREPAARIQSAINYLRVTPFDVHMGGPTPWAWLARGLLASEVAYSEIEQDWYTRPDGPRRCIVRFSDYVRDLEGTLRRVYRECLDEPELPPWAPREHAPRRRHGYTHDRSLADLGIDEDALNARLADYVAWCRGEGDTGQRESAS